MAATRTSKLGLDWWSVIAALLAVLLVRAGVLTHVPW
jgi:hypothetical protein